MTYRYPEQSDAPWELLARHLAAEASVDERRALREWVQADPTHLQILTTVTRAWERAGEAAATPVLFSPADVEAAWQRFRPLLTTATLIEPAILPVTAAKQPTLPLQNSELPSHATTYPISRPLWRMQRRQRQRWQLAAGLLLLLGAGYWLRGMFLQQPQIANYKTTNQRQRQELPDGSVVWLNTHSQLRYTWDGPQARSGVRSLQLTGEAYFEVAPNPAQPFLVYTTTARVRVTGTAFNVRAFAAEDSVEVSVTHGRVWLRHLTDSDSVLLTANTRAALYAADAPGHVAHPLRQTPLPDANFRAWQTDTLRFQDASVAQVAHTLRTTFGTMVRLNGTNLARCRFTGTFAQPQPRQVLAVLAATTASQLRADGHGGYVLEGPGCITPDPVQQ